MGIFSGLKKFAAPLLGIAGGLGQSALNARQSRRNIRRTHQQNMELAEFQFNKDVEMWNLQNEYNTPAAQMRRFEEAGLNKNLIYGQGTPGNAQQLPQFQSPTFDYTSQRPPVDISSTIHEFQNIQQKSAQLNLSRQQVKTDEALMWLRKAQQVGQWNDNDINNVEAKLSKNLLFNETKMNEMQGRFNDAQLAKLVKTESEAIIQKKFAEWAKNGINPHDATWLRMTVEFLQTLGWKSKEFQKKVKSILDSSGAFKHSMTKYPKK